MTAKVTKLATMMTCRRSLRSPMAPARRVKENMETVRLRPTRATCQGEPVMLWMSQPMTRSSDISPLVEMLPLVSRYRKFRFRMTFKRGLLDLGRTAIRWAARRGSGGTE